MDDRWLGVGALDPDGVAESIAGFAGAFAEPMPGFRAHGLRHRFAHRQAALVLFGVFPVSGEHSLGRHLQAGAFADNDVTRAITTPLFQEDNGAQARISERIEEAFDLASL